MRDRFDWRCLGRGSRSINLIVMVWKYYIYTYFYFLPLHLHILSVCHIFCSCKFTEKPLYYKTSIFFSFHFSPSPQDLHLVHDFIFQHSSSTRSPHFSNTHDNGDSDCSESNLLAKTAWGSGNWKKVWYWRPVITRRWRYDTISWVDYYFTHHLFRRLPEQQLFYGVTTRMERPLPTIWLYGFNSNQWQQI